MTPNLTPAPFGVYIGSPSTTEVIDLSTLQTGSRGEAPSGVTMNDMIITSITSYQMGGSSLRSDAEPGARAMQAVDAAALGHGTEGGTQVFDDRVIPAIEGRTADTMEFVPTDPQTFEDLEGILIVAVPEADGWTWAGTYFPEIVDDTLDFQGNRNLDEDTRPFEADFSGGVMPENEAGAISEFAGSITDFDV